MLSLALLLAAQNGPTPGLCNALADRIQFGTAEPTGPRRYTGVAAELKARFGKAEPSEADRATLAETRPEQLEAFARMCFIPRK